MLYIYGNEVKADTFGNNAATFQGINSCIGWDAHKVVNLGIDRIGTHQSPVSNSINIMNDSDILDNQGFIKTILRTNVEE